MITFHMKNVVHFNFKNKSRLILAILVIGIAISTLFTLNGLLDIYSNNITSSIIDQLPDADFAISSNKDPFVSNYSSMISTIQTNDNLVDGVTARYTIDGGIYLRNALGDQFIVPTQVIAINFTKENQMGLGSFTPDVQTLSANQCVVIGSFGTQLLKAVSGNSIDVTMLLQPNVPVNMSLSIVSQADQNKKFYSGYQNLIVVDYSTLASFNLTDTATSLLGVFKDHQNLYSLDSIETIDQTGIKRGSDIQDLIGYNYTINMVILSALSAVQNGLNGQRVLVNLIALIMIMLSTILIFSIMNNSFKDLTHEYGIFKAIGLKDRWIFVNALFNTVFVGVLGIIAGFFIGYVFLSLANNSLGEINAFIEVNPNTILFVIAVGAIMIIISGLYPAYIVSRKNVLVSLDISRIESTDFESRVESYRFKFINKKNIVRGFQLSALGLFLFVFLPWLNFVFDQSMTNNVGILLLIMTLVGFIFIISGFFGPILQKGISFIIGIIFPKIGFATNLLLRKTTNKNTSNSVIFALSLAFIFFLNTLQATSINGSIYALQSQIGSDLVVYTPKVNGKSVSEEILNFTSNYQGIKSGFITFNGFYYLIGSSIRLGDNINFNSFSPTIYGASSNLPDALKNQIIFYDGSDYHKVSDNNTVVISGGMAKAFKVGLGDKLRLDVTSPIQANNEKYGKTLQLTIVAIMKSLAGFPTISDNVQDAARSPVFIGKNTWQSIVQPNAGFNDTNNFVFEQNIQQIFVKGNGADLSEYKNQLFIKFGSNAFVVDYQERLDSLLKNLNSSLFALTLILSFSTIIAFFAVISSTISYINESKREIAIMKALGVKENQIKNIFTLEAVIVSFTASLLGSIAGYLMGMIAEFSNSLNQSRPLEIVFPPLFVIFTFILVVLFSVIGSYFPARKVYKIDTVKNLQ